MSSPNRSARGKLEKIDVALAENLLARVPLGKDKGNIFTCVSWALYSTTEYTEAVQDKCLQTLKDLLSTNAVPQRIRDYCNHVSFAKDYASNPTLPGFDKVTLELLSIAFKVRVVVYTITDDLYLTSLIVSNDMTKKLRLVKIATNHYEPVFKKDFLANFDAYKSVLENTIIDNAYLEPVKPAISSADAKHFAIGHERITKQIDPLPLKAEESATISIPPKLSLHKKSLSDYLGSFYGDSHTATREPWNIPFVAPAAAQHDDVQFALNGGNTHKKSDVSLPDEVKSSLRAVFDDSYLPDQGKYGMSKSHMARAFQPQMSGAGWAYPPVREGMMQGNDPFKPFQSQASYQGFFDQQKQPTSAQANFMMMFNQGSMTPSQYFSGGQDEPKSPSSLMNLDLARFNSSGEKRKPIVLDEGRTRYFGRLKFFDEAKNYGFIIMDLDGSDMFVHYDDLAKAKINKELLRSAKQGNIIRLSFACMSYIGKYDKSRKAVDIQLLAE